MSDTILEVKVTHNKPDSQAIEEVFAIYDLFPSFLYDLEKNVGYFSFFFNNYEEMYQQLTMIKKISLENKLEVAIEEIKKENWQESWKKYFHTKKVSKRFVIKPSWENYLAKKNEIIIEIDPGMSFGTGQHGTTQSCLNFIDNFSTKTAKHLIIYDRYRLWVRNFIHWSITTRLPRRFI